MSIDTSLIWRAIGDFWDMFPEEERVYWSTFWEAYGEIVADLWGYAVQVDDGKSLYDTTATMERRSVLVTFTNLEASESFNFTLSRIWKQSGTWLVRGYVPREYRTFKSASVPQRGIIVIGEEVIDYTSANVTTFVGGVFDGYVQEVTFTLAREPVQDYSDSLELNDAFDSVSYLLKTRVSLAPGAATVDAVRVYVNDQVSPNPTGRLVLGASGVNLETVLYSGVTVVGDRYIFTLAPGESIANAHVQDEFLTVTAYDGPSWSQSVIGSGVWYADNSASALVGITGSGEMTLSSLRPVRAGGDFDLSVSVGVRDWPAPAVDGNRRALARVFLGTTRLVIGLRTERVAGLTTEYLVYGVAGAESQEALSSVPESFQSRFVRTGSTVDLYYKASGDPDWRLLTRVATVGSQQATLDLFAQRLGLDSPILVSFDEVIRRAGSAAGSTRLEETFSSNVPYPYTYTCDQVIAGAETLIDRPRKRSEPMVTSVDVVDREQKFLRATAGNGFDPLGLPQYGTITLSGKKIVYQRVTLKDGVYEFQLRSKLPPDIVPLPAGAVFTASTRELSQGSDYVFDGLGKVSFRTLPTRDRMWAPLAQVDYRHVQKFYGVMTDATSDKSTDQYLSRVQGTWLALTNGPAIGNVYSGLHLAMGLPTARVSGIVRAVSESRDELGRLIEKSMLISGVDGEFNHTLPGSLPLLSWRYNVGDSVEKFSPLCDGVEVLDYQSDPLWHNRFPGISDIERFNSFGVFVAVEALSSASNVTEAVRFALRIKPSYTKLVIRFLLTTSGRELLDPQDDTFAAHVPRFCEDVGFEYGEPDPDDLMTIRRLGEGYRLGSGLRLGSYGVWSYLPLGTEAVMLTATSDGSWTAGSALFTSAGAHAFTAADVGHFVRIASGPDAGTWQIMSVASASQVALEHVFSSSSSSAGWSLVDVIDLGDGLAAGTTLAFTCHPTGVGRGGDSVEYQQLVTISSSA